MVLRRLKLDICNAGYDDGIPTSALREIAISTKLAGNKSNISPIVAKEIKGVMFNYCLTSMTLTCVNC